MNPLWLFAIATLTPVPLIAGAALFGGLWVLAALAYLIIFTALLDEVITWVMPSAEGDEFPAATALSAGLAIIHFALLALTVWALATSDQSLPEKLGTYLAAGLFFGQVSNANAHELIHRPKRWLHRLGTWVYITLLFGHHASAHPLVHHIHVATRTDPSSARLGESFYRFAYRAWRGSFLRGWQAETLRGKRIGRAAWRHPYATYIAGGLVCMVAAWGLGGPLGLLIYGGLAGMAQCQLLMSDYVQHYGLIRKITNGVAEPVDARHSWNSPHLVSSALMMNAPRHSDHHTRPNRPYIALDLPPDGPMLPRSLPVMAFVALNPRRWRRVMDPLARQWHQIPAE